MTHPTDLLNRAHELAPTPDADGDRNAWIRHYAAQAMAALAAFRIVERTNPGPNLGYLILLHTAAAAAVVTLEAPADQVTRLLWELNPDGDAMNGEMLEHLADTLEMHGINPADLYPWYDAKDFTSPTRLPKVEVA